MDNKDIFKCIKIINETNIEYKIRNGKDYNIDNVIREMLKDERIFFKISKEKAYKILRVLEIENLDNVYEKLISEENIGQNL